MQLVFRFINSFSVLAVNDEDETLSASVVVTPQRPDFVLSTDIPYIKLDILVCDGLDVEADCPTGRFGDGLEMRRSARDHDKRPALNSERTSGDCGDGLI